jgi:hypothetical protein
MKTSLFSTLIAGVITLLISCSKSEPSSTTYKITKSEIDISSPNLVDSLDAVIFKEKCKIYFTNAFVKLYAKDTITVLTEMGDFTFGKFTSEKKEKLDFNLFDLGEFQFSTREEADEQGDPEYLVLTGSANGKYSVKLLLKKDESFEYEKKDLMSVSSNNWRIKPQKSETDSEIKNRVMAQLDYMIDYFTFINDEGHSSFMVGHLRSPFKFYSNGIGIKEITLADFNKNFYDENDSQKALGLLISGLNSISVYPADEKSFTKGYSNALKEILRFLKVS